MKLKEFIENLTEFVKKHPEALNMEIITSSDDEDNGYNFVYHEPSFGIYDDDEFISFDNYEDYERTEDETNVVCIN